MAPRDGGGDGTRPPLLRSTRGRHQSLPSRFNDSVLDSWKNQGVKVEDTDSSFEDDADEEKKKKGDNYCALEVNIEMEKNGFVKTESNSSVILCLVLKVVWSRRLKLLGMVVKGGNRFTGRRISRWVI
ncbi:hypothetical protein HN51_012906 [Arachis hypogaea]